MDATGHPFRHRPPPRDDMDLLHATGEQGGQDARGHHFVVFTTFQLLKFFRFQRALPKGDES